MRADLDIHEKSQRAFVSVVRAYKGTHFTSFTRTKVQILTPEELQRGARPQRTPVYIYFSDGEAVAWRPRLRYVCERKRESERESEREAVAWRPRLRCVSPLMPRLQYARPPTCVPSPASPSLSSLPLRHCPPLSRPLFLSLSLSLALAGALSRSWGGCGLSGSV
jgi:hypothetical protein